jgi:signal transduction histidine kinase/DNA-binding response OmpR family regulator
MKFKDRTKRLTSIKSKVRTKNSNRSWFLLLVVPIALNSIAIFGILESLSEQRDRQIISRYGDRQTVPLVDAAKTQIKLKLSNPQLRLVEQGIYKYWSEINYLLSAIFLSALNYGWITLLLKSQNRGSDRLLRRKTTEPAVTVGEKYLNSVNNILPDHEISQPKAISSSSNHQPNPQAHQVNPLEVKHPEKTTDYPSNDEPYTLLADMSHELRSPLNAILGFAQIMEQELAAIPASLENLAIINRSGENLLSIINDVVDLAKIKTNRLTLEDNNVDFHVWLDNIEQSFQFQSQRNGWEFSLIREGNLPQWICIDERRLRQILRNLSNYCLKPTTPQNVSLRVSAHSLLQPTQKASQDNSPQEYKVMFEVEHHNLSIPTQELATLFDPLVRVRQESKSPEGSSLNLPISLKLAQLMGGDITVSNNAFTPSGIIFNLEIHTKSVVPQTLQTQSTLRRIVGLESDQVEYRILVVDDSKTNRAIMKQILEPVGFKVEEAVNGQEAIDIWFSWQPHMIWMDLKMPVMNGCEATKRIKSYSQNLFTPIVALSASTLEEDRTLFKAAGCDDFVGKPFSDKIIFDKIAQHLGIRYVYESILPSTTSNLNNFKLTAESLNVMSHQWLTQLEQAAIVLDQDLLTQLVQKIPSEHLDLKNALQKEIDNFDFDQILNLARKSRSN